MIVLTYGCDMVHSFDTLVVPMYIDIFAIHDLFLTKNISLYGILW